MHQADGKAVVTSVREWNPTCIEVSFSPGMDEEALKMRAALLHVTSALLLCLPLADTVGAQTRKPDQTLTTIVGCLVHGNPSAAGSERRSGTSDVNVNDYFLRTPAITVPVGGTVSVGGTGAATSGGKATTSAGDPDRTTLYRITGMDHAQLKPHVGHRVELQGHLSGNTGTAGSGTTTKTTVDAAGKPTVRVETRLDLAGVLNATTLKMVSASCP